MSHTIPRPEATEYAPQYETYVVKVPAGNLLTILEVQRVETQRLLEGVAEARGAHRYAPEKWTVKQVVGHIMDAERVFGSRALRFARGDRTPLPGFDENVYAATGGFDVRLLADLARELDVVRRDTMALFSGFDPEMLARRGIANGKEISVRALAYVIAGHERHHVAILRERYRI